MRKYLIYSLKTILLFIIFGFIYICVELLYRGYSHITMFICGGLSSIEIGLLNEFPKYKYKRKTLNIFIQMLIGAFIITLNEFIFGIIFNTNLTIWNYSNLPFNVLGQICLPFSFIWFLLSYMIIQVDDFLRYKWLEPKHYLHKMNFKR